MGTPKVSSLRREKNCPLPLDIESLGFSPQSRHTQITKTEF